MDTTTRSPSIEIGRRGRVKQRLMIAALACFALPFVTVTCYGDNTVSGVQAATKIDLYPNDHPGERELVREEPPNVFALGALVATVGALVLAFRRRVARTTFVGWAAAAVFALDGFYLYAFHRSWGEALPEIGLTGAIALLVAAAWLATERMPRWIGWSVGLLAVSTIPGSFMHDMTIDLGPWLFLVFYAGLIGSVALAVGAIQASRRSRFIEIPPRPSALRIAAIGVVMVAIFGAVAVVAPYVMASVLHPPYDEASGVGPAIAYATVVLAILIGGSAAAWAAGRAIARGGRRPAIASMAGV
jgi:hypothetical protein